MEIRTILKQQNLNLPMNRIIYFIIILLTSIGVHSQTPNLSLWSNTYMNIYSYEGTTQPNSITIRISQNGYLNIQNWKLSVIATPVTIWNGLFFPVEKINLQPNYTTGTVKDPGPLPTISEIGIPATLNLIGNSEVFLVPRSNAPIYNIGTGNSYYDLQILFNMNVVGGSYLTKLKTNSPQYPINMRFTLYGANNEIIGTTNLSYTIQVHTNLTGTPPSENTYSIQISTGARNGQLNMNSLADYANGASVLYNNGLSVSTNIDYQISVRSISSTFISSSGNSLPLDVVNVQLRPSSDNKASSITRSISSTSQIISTGSSTNKLPAYYDIHYYTNPNDQRLIQAKMEDYSTTLQYEITPK